MQIILDYLIFKNNEQDIKIGTYIQLDLFKCNE